MADLRGRRAADISNKVVELRERCIGRIGGATMKVHRVKYIVIAGFNVVVVMRHDYPPFQFVRSLRDFPFPFAMALSPSRR